MKLRALFSLRPTRAGLGVRWLVLVVILFGTILSSMGGTSSHGLDASHGHAHEDLGGELVRVDNSASADHPHHEMDHSHDKAHALSVAWRTATPQPSSWLLLVRPWIEMVEASRLERPPMG
jgi:ABC-type nickel/cobalt efflux system permease component RcnA